MSRPRSALLAFALMLVAPVPAHAATVEIRGQDTLTWDPPAVRIAPGDDVVWTFPGTTQAHNVSSRSADWAFRSTPAVPALGVAHRFDREGVFAFVCEMHPGTMAGEITVARPDVPPPPPPPPLPPGRLPLDNDSEPLTVVETGGLDREPPAVTSLRVRGAGRGARVRLRVSEASTVTVVVARGRRTVRRVTAWTSGVRALTVRARRLGAGRHRVQVTATDVAGNRSRVRTAGVTLR